MSNDVMFEGKERRMAGIKACLAEYGIADLEEARSVCEAHGIHVDEIVKGVQPLRLITQAGHIHSDVPCQ